LQAPAKINLHLRVGPPTPDGFHPLLSWMCTVSLFDILTLARSENGGSLPVQMTCDDPKIPCDATNLIARVGAVLADAIRGAAGETGGKEVSVEVSDKLFQVTVALQKRIPTGGGLGGGSSDGARAMFGLDRLWRANLGRERLAELSSRCGSDLPFFFFGPSSICTGRGEFVRPTAPPASRWALLILPSIAMPTADVYRKFDEMRLGDLDRLAAEPDWKAWAQLPALELLPRLVNDLEVPSFALRPELGRLRAAIELQLARPVRMSGSGSSLFTLFDDRAAAEQAAEQVSEKHVVKSLAAELAPDFSDDLEIPA
jgi:4-diphosphocytidyl-2-C-methyl-D-erythritol kinase